MVTEPRQPHARKPARLTRPGPGRVRPELPQRHPPVLCGGPTQQRASRLIARPRLRKPATPLTASTAISSRNHTKPTKKDVMTTQQIGVKTGNARYDALRHGLNQRWIARPDYVVVTTRNATIHQNPTSGPR